MPRIRFPSPFTVGLAAGIPSATQGILGVMDIAERRAGRLGRQALESRQMGILEQAAAREEQREQASAALPGLFETLSRKQTQRRLGVPAVNAGPIEALATLQPDAIPGIVPFEQAAGIPTEEDLAAQEARLIGTGFQARVGPEVIRTVQSLRAEAEAREHRDRALGLFTKAGEAFKTGDFDSAYVMTSHAALLTGQKPPSYKEFQDLKNLSPETFKEDMKAFGEELAHCKKGGWDLECSIRAYAKLGSARNPAVQALGQVFLPMIARDLERTQLKPILDRFYELSRERAQQPTGPGETRRTPAEVSADAYEALEVEDPMGAQRLTPFLPKGIQTVLEARKQATITGAKKKAELGAVPQAERALNQRLKEAQATRAEKEAKLAETREKIASGQMGTGAIKELRLHVETLNQTMKSLQDIETPGAADEISRLARVRKGFLDEIERLGPKPKEGQADPRRAQVPPAQQTEAGAVAEAQRLMGLMPKEWTLEQKRRAAVEAMKQTGWNVE